MDHFWGAVLRHRRLPLRFSEFKASRRGEGAQLTMERWHDPYDRVGVYGTQMKQVDVTNLLAKAL